MSCLKDFTAVPDRAIGDRRLRERDVRVLMAICRSVDSRTGIATISQGRIGEKCGCSRQKANASIKLLNKLGYIEKVGIRYGRSGGGGYLRYRIIYDLSATAVSAPDTRSSSLAVTPADDSGAVTAIDDLGMLSAGVTQFRSTEFSLEKDEILESTAVDVSRSDGTDLWRQNRDRILDDFARLRRRQHD